MGREIKFRAWCKHDNKMYVNVPSNVVRFSGNTFKPHSFFGDDPLEDHAVLMQYTGLKDKNGVEIYEGDVIWDETGNNATVFYSNEHCQFLADFGEGIDYQELGLWCEVTGNIYENPELLS